MSEKQGWERWAWLVGAVWIVFLGFPLANAYLADVPDVVRWGMVAGILLFGALYMRLMAVALIPTDDYAVIERRVLPLMTGMTLIFVGSTVGMGVDALGMMPFLAASAAFTLRIKAAVAAVIASLLVTLSLPLLIPGQRYGLFYLAIVVSVAVFSLFMRLLEDREAEEGRLQRELDIVGERERVARDVHDVVGHSLTAVSTKAELAERLIDLDPDGARRELQQIQSLTRESLAEIRATIAGLRVARLGDELAAARTALGDIGIVADLPESAETVDPRHRIVCAWVLREAVTNVVRHSGASRCTVILHGNGISIVDDGRGRGDTADGNGVTGMRERVAGAGGTFTIEAPSEGSGTRIEVRL